MRRPRGFTLIECIIGVFVVAVGFLAVASMYPTAYRGATLDLNHTMALQLASATLANVRAVPYGTAIPATALTPLNKEATNESSQTYVTMTRTVTFVRGGATADANAISDVAVVTVTWTEGTGAGSAGVQKQIVLRGGVTRVP